MIYKYLYRAWRFKNRVEQSEIACVEENIRPGQTVVDIGANKGAFTYWMHKAVGPEGKVVAFEPQPELIKYLSKIKQHMAWDNVDIVGKGVSEEECEMTLYRPDPYACLGASLSRGVHLGGHRLKVPVESLDGYMTRTGNRPVSFIKCDVEGHELQVFRGAEAILREDRPMLIFDCEARHHFMNTPEDVLAYLYDIGYEGTFFLDGMAHDAADFDSQIHQDRNAKSYAYSFVFRPRVAVPMLRAA